MISPGNKVRLRSLGRRSRLLHIVAIVDDDFIVFKEWRRSKKYWAYEIEHRYWFDARRESGLIEVVK
jgi:hypothetical protein